MICSDLVSVFGVSWLCVRLVSMVVWDWCWLVCWLVCLVCVCILCWNMVCCGLSWVFVIDCFVGKFGVLSIFEVLCFMFGE